MRKLILAALEGTCCVGFGGVCGGRVADESRTPAAAPSREQLMHLLAEATELEHNLLCSYLFAMFSMKESAEEDLEPHELAAVRRWRNVLLGVCVEEMNHLAQVSNLAVALGFRPHLNRPNLPVGPGYHPAAVVVELSRFDLDTLDHLIFLERPEGIDAQDGASFTPSTPYVRSHLAEGLMPGGPEYETIGEFYDVLRRGLVSYAHAHGTAKLLLGPEELQLQADEVGGGTLRVVRTLDDACLAIDDIVRQGEGAPGDSETSHYAQFREMRAEFEALLAARPEFAPARDVGRNPVMRPPTEPGRTHVTAKRAAVTLDAANSLYAFMLRCLAQCYATPRTDAARRAVLGAALTAMKAFSQLACELTLMPAADDGSDVRAGMSFTMLRAVEGAAPGVDGSLMLAERLGEIRRAVPGLDVSAPGAHQLQASLAKIAENLGPRWADPSRP